MRHALLAVAATLAVLPLGARAQKNATASSQENARWALIRRVFGQGEAEEGYLRVNLPRTDLHVRIGNDSLSPDFEFRSFIGFVPVGSRDVLAMGEIVVLQTEVPALLEEARRQNVRVTAVHNHLLGETPRMMYAHVMAEGAAEKVAGALHATFARTATPLAPLHNDPARVSWSSIDAVLGPHAEAAGSIAEYEFTRNEAIHVHGVRVKSSGTLETASEAVFEQLGAGRVASTGELYLLPGEVQPVLTALEEHALHVTALHNHMLDDGPPHFWVHWYSVGDGPTLARGVAAALAHMNGARKSKAGE